MAGQIVCCMETTKGSWLRVGMRLKVVREDDWGRYYFENGGVAHKRLFFTIQRG